VLGRHTLEVARLEMSYEERAEARRAVAEHGRWRGEVVAYRKDGTSVWVEVVTVALHDARGQITGYLEVHRDVTARRRAEEALREAQAQRAAADRRLQEVREAERSRIARDLHDGALQGLTHALVVSDRHGPSRDDELFGILQRVGGQVRAAIYGLEEHGERAFSEALRELVEVNGEMTPACDVRLEADAGLPDGSFGSRGTEVLRIIGEALTNACRHAGAERIVVRVTGPATRLCVEVTDDGRGFRPTPALRGQGLRGMHERAELLGADLDIRSDHTGTTVRLVAALSSPD
jgi:signal transduction histidine kinase